MHKYVYPAIFSPEIDGGYSICFPDFESCYTSAKTLEDGLIMASDVLALTLYDFEENQMKIPEPSQIKCIQTKGEEFTTLVYCNTIEYRKRFDNKAVKKR